MKVLVGCERFGKVRDAFRRQGHAAWSCDLAPDATHSDFHMQCDVRAILHGPYGPWDLAIFHPDCTYLTNSAEWAYGDGPYHQKVKPGTLVGAARRQARRDAVSFIEDLRAAPIPRKAFENPIGHLSSAWRKPDQTIQPHQFGDDASKATCLWLENLPPLIPTKLIPPRMVGGKPRWANQTDGGQNKLTPSDDRAMLRAATYPGIADAMADQWGNVTTLHRQFRDAQTGQYAFDQDFDRLCKCGHSLGVHSSGGFYCNTDAIGNKEPEAIGCQCERFRPNGLRRSLASTSQARGGAT